MDKYIKVYDNVLDEDSCKSFIEKFKDSNHLHDHVHEQDGDERISFSQIVLEGHPEWESVQDDLLELFKDYIQRYKIDCKLASKQWPEKYGFEAVRMKQYLEKD